MRLCNPSARTSPRTQPSTAPTSLMSQTASTSTSSSRFQAIFNDALKLYQKQTKKDLTTHPLASQLQSCNSTTAIIAVLQDQVREFDQAHSGDDRLTKWLNPTVNVLCAFSTAVSGGVSLVSLNISPKLSLEVSSEIFFKRYFRLRVRSLQASAYSL
jgi:hypothetical protein